MNQNQLLEKNLQALEKNSNHVISPFNPQKQHFVLFTEKKNEVIIAKNDKYLRYNNSDTEEFIGDLDFDRRGTYFISGLLDLGAIQEIYNHASQESVIFVVEPNPEVFYYVITHYDLSELFVRDNFYLLVADYESAPEYFSDYLLKKTMIIKVSNLQFYTARYLLTFENAKVLELQKAFINNVKSNLFNIGNSTHDTMIGLLQNLLNLKTFMNTMSIQKIKGQYSNVPAIIVSAGPSLEKNIHYLKQVPRENFLLLAVDTTLKKLLDMGIVPDAVLSVERPETVYEYFYKNIEIPSKTVFVGMPVVHPKILKKFPHNRMLFTLRDTEKINEWLNYLVSNQSDLMPIGPSVANLTFSFARYIGCEPIIFIGQDLAFGEDGHTHSKGTAYDERKIKRKHEELWVEGYYGKEVKTTRTWKNFIIWFEEQFFKTGQLIINATEGGAKIKHCIQMPFEEALHKYATKKCVPLHKFIDEQFEPIFEEKTQLQERIQKEINDLKKFSSLLESFFKGLENIEDEINQTFEEGKFEYWLKKLAEIDRNYKKGLISMKLFTVFVHTHIAISSFEFNKLDRSKTNEYLLGTIAIQRKLYSVSKDLCELVEGELIKYLNTTF